MPAPLEGQQRSAPLRPVLGPVRLAIGAVACAAAATIGVGVACTAGAGKVTGTGVVSIVIAPDSATVVAGTTQSFAAQPEDASGKPVAGITVIWASADSTLATVSQSGVVTAVKAGTVRIAAAAQGVNGYATVTISAVPVGTVVVVPAAVTLRTGATTQLTDTLKDAKGNVMTGPTTTWASGDTTIATVSQTGLVTGHGVGTTQVTASAGGKTGSATITVTLVPVALVRVAPANDTITVGQNVTFVATALDSVGNTLMGRVASWSSNNSAVATVVASSGVVTGAGVGTAVITATIEGVQGGALITVIQPPVASVAISPHPATVAINSTGTLTATLKDAKGDTLVGRTLTWKSSDAATVSLGAFTGQMQTITGHKAGTVTITATSPDGPVGRDSVTVIDPVNHIVVMTPNPFKIRDGYTANVTAQAFDVNNMLISGITFTWSTESGGTIASVDGSGVVTGKSPGADSVYASAQGKRGSAAVTVLPDSATSVSVSPSPDTIYASAPNNTVGLTATQHDSTGKTTATPLTWSSSSGVATVSGSGNSATVTGANTSAGSTTIMASTGGGVHGQATVVVIGHVATVAVSTSLPSGAMSATGILLPQSATAMASLTDSFGNNVTSQRGVTWSTSDATTVTINGSSNSTVSVGSGSTITLAAVSTNSSSVTIVATSPDGAQGAVTINIFP